MTYSFTVKNKLSNWFKMEILKPTMIIWKLHSYPFHVKLSYVNALSFLDYTAFLIHWSQYLLF